MKTETIHKVVETFNSSERSRDFLRGYTAAIRIVASGDKRLATVLKAEGWSL